MNDARRKEIDRAIALIEEAATIIEQERNQEQDYFDNMPEGLQGAEKGEKAQEAIDELDQAHSDLDEIKAALERAKE